MAYSYNDISSSKIMLSPLESALRELHSFVGNAETKGYIIFPSLGATQGVEAALSAISMSICEVSSGLVYWTNVSTYRSFFVVYTLNCYRHSIVNLQLNVLIYLSSNFYNTACIP